MHKVYKIENKKINDNRYGVGRTEDWVIIQDGIFETYNAARDYVISQSFKHTDLPLYTHDKQGEEREKMIKRFCFEDERFLIYRKYFIGKPDVKNIKKELERNHIKVIDI